MYSIQRKINIFKSFYFSLAKKRSRSRPKKSAPAPAQIVYGLRLQPKNLGSATLCSSINFSLIYCPPIFKILPLICKPTQVLYFTELFPLKSSKIYRWCLRSHCRIRIVLGKLARSYGLRGHAILALGNPLFSKHCNWMCKSTLELHFALIFLQSH